MVLLCCRCAALLDSSPPAVQFVASNSPNVVHFVLNTSCIIPEVRLCLKRVAFAFGCSVLMIVTARPPAAFCPLHRPHLRPAPHFWL